MRKKWNLYKKLHRWPGLIISFILIYYAATGIFLNHREVVSGLDVRRSMLPENYRYNNWNNAALKGNLVINSDSIIVYGGIGIWITDSAFQNYVSFHDGFPEGIDNRKIYDVHRTSNGSLYVAALSGLYGYDLKARKWKKLEVNDGTGRFTGIESINDTLYAINRSHLFKGLSKGTNTVFNEIELPAPEGYVNKVTLFQTIWQIHSGEILGLPGKLYVDILGLITLFLSVTGVIYFFFPFLIKRLTHRNKSAVKISRVSRWSLRWHNRTGAWTFIFLIVLFFTGMFLRPPLLITIANIKVGPLKYSHLDQPDPWYDKLRDLLYDSIGDQFILSTSEGMYYMNPVALKPVRYPVQPPVSVMGINVLEKTSDSAFLIGSFSGIFLWEPDKPEVLNLFTGKTHTGNSIGRPVGDIKVTGAITGCNGEMYLVDYDAGILPFGNHEKFPEMPGKVLCGSAMSLWNVCLEIHTGRFFQNWIGNWYILIVPLTGLAGIMIVISGYILWRRKHKISDT